MSPCLDTSVFYQLREGNINRVFIYYSLRGNILYLWVWDSTHHLLLMVCAIFISDGRVEVDRYIRASSVVMQAWVLFLDLLVNLRSYHNQWSRALSGDYGYKWLWLKWAPSIGSVFPYVAGWRAQAAPLLLVSESVSVGGSGIYL